MGYVTSWRKEIRKVSSVIIVIYGIIQNAAQLVMKCTISLLAHLVHRYVVECGLPSFFL